MAVRCSSAKVFLCS